MEDEQIYRHGKKACFIKVISVPPQSETYNFKLEIFGTDTHLGQLRQNVGELSIMIYGKHEVKKPQVS